MLVTRLLEIEALILVLLVVWRPGVLIMESNGKSRIREEAVMCSINGGPGAGRFLCSRNVAIRRTKSVQGVMQGSRCRESLRSDRMGQVCLGETTVAAVLGVLLSQFVTSALAIAPDVHTPPGYQLYGSEYFVVECPDGETHMAYRVVDIEQPYDFSGGLVPLYYSIGRIENWVVFDSEGRLEEDVVRCQEVAMAACTAYRIYYATEVSYSGGRVPQDLWSSDVLQDKANQFLDFVAITPALDFLQAVGNLAAKGISSILTGGYSEAIKLPAREALKHVASEVVKQAIKEFAKAEVTTPEGAYKNILRARAALAAYQLNSLAGQNITVRIGDTVSLAEMDAFREAVAQAISMGDGAIDGLYQFYDGGPCQYLMGVIESGDPTGFIETVDSLILADPSLAQAMEAATGWEGMFEGWNAGLLQGALAVRDAFRSVNQTLILQVVAGDGSYELGESIAVYVSVENHQGVQLADAEFSLLVRQAQATVLGPVNDVSPTGQWQYSFDSAELGATGVFDVVVSAEKEGFLAGEASTSFTVSMPPQVGHDVGVTGIDWDDGISPDVGDLRLAVGESIEAQVQVENFGDHAELDIPVRMSLVTSEGVVAASDTAYVSLAPGEQAFCTLQPNMSTVEDGIYRLIVTTDLVGDADAKNNGVTWDQIIVGKPGPKPGQLPYASFAWYRCQHNSTSTSSPEDGITGYNLSFSYASEGTVVLSSHGQVLGSLNVGDPPTTYDSNNIIAWLQSAMALTGGTYHMILYAGVRAPFAQDDGMQEVYAFPGAGAYQCYYEIDPRYTAFFDYYLPSGISNDVYLHMWNPKIGGLLNDYVHQWTTIDKKDVTGSYLTNYDSSLVVSTGARGSGGIDDYYVLVPDTAMPEGDYNLLIIQETDTLEEGWRSAGFAHSVRLSVSHYRDGGILHVLATPETPQSGDAVQFTIALFNAGDAPLNDMVVSLNIRGPDGYNRTLANTVSSLARGAQEETTFEWDTTMLAGGIYTITCTLSAVGDADLNSNSYTTTVELQPPPPPPSLQVSIELGKTVYSESEAIVGRIVVSDDQGRAADAHVSWQLMRSQQCVESGQGESVGGEYAFEGFVAPESPGRYELHATAGKTGFTDGHGTVGLTVEDTVPPTRPVGLSPAGAALNTQPISFSWMPSQDSGSELITYGLQVDDDPAFGSPEVNVTIPDSAYSLSTSLAPNVYSWHVNAADESGNSSGWSSPQSFTFDTMAPVVEIVTNSGADFESNDPTVVLEGTAIDTGVSSGVCYVSTEPEATNEGTLEEWCFTVSLVPGSNPIVVRALDGAGNIGQDTITITYAATGSLQVALKPEAVVDAGAQWRVDAGAWHASGQTQDALTAGSHTLEFKAVDGWNEPFDRIVKIDPNETRNELGVYCEETPEGPWSVTPVVATTANEILPAWSPDGEKIAFVSDETGTHQVYLVNADGTDKWQVTSGPNSVGEIVWGRYGQRLFYDTNDIVMVELNPKRTQVDSQCIIAAAWEATGWDCPRVSPDSGQIVAMRRPDQSHPILMLMDAACDAGTTAVEVGSGEVSNRATWGPFGDCIAYMHCANTGMAYPTDIWLWSDGQPTKIVDRSAIGFHVNTFAWSPDGSRLAFSDGYYSNSMGIVDAGGSGFVVLDDGPASFYSQFYSWLPDIWSPDGQSILYSRQEEGAWNVYLINSDGSNRRAVVLSSGDDQFARFGAAGEIVFQTNREGNWDIYVASAQDDTGFTVGGAVFTDVNNVLTTGLEGVPVTVAGDGGTFDATTVGSQGLWEIQDVPEGTYVVAPSKSGYNFDHVVAGVKVNVPPISIQVDETNEAANQSIQFLATVESSATGPHDWNGDGIVSIVGDVPPFVDCVYFGNCPEGIDVIAVGDCNGDGIVSIVGDVPCFVDCVYFGDCPD